MPAVEGVAGLGGGTQRDCRSLHVVTCRIARTVAAAVQLVLYLVVPLRNPLGVEGDGSTSDIGQVGHLLLIAIELAITATPAGEGVAGAGELVGRQLPCFVVGECLVVHAARTAVRLKFHIVGVGRPLSGEDYGSCRALGNGSHLAAVVLVPAVEGVAGLGGGSQRDCRSLHVVACRVAAVAAAVQLVLYLVVPLHNPLGVQGDALVLGVGGSLLIAVAGAVGTGVPAVEGIAVTGEIAAVALQDQRPARQLGLALGFRAAAGLVFVVGDGVGAGSSSCSGAVTSSRACAGSCTTSTSSSACAGSASAATTRATASTCTCTGSSTTSTSSSACAGSASAATTRATAGSGVGRRILLPLGDECHRIVNLQREGDGAAVPRPAGQVVVAVIIRGLQVPAANEAFVGLVQLHLGGPAGGEEASIRLEDNPVGGDARPRCLALDSIHVKGVYLYLVS